MKWSGIALILFLTIASACGKKEADVGKEAESVINSVSPDSWRKLTTRRIFFAHMSVGHNIIQGVRELEDENPRLGVRLVETRTSHGLETPALAHSLNGVNGDPMGKIAAFRQALDGGLGPLVDIALLKFCYVDFRTNKEVSRVFEEYKKTMTSLKATYPRLTIVHVTVPLTVVQTGPKAWVKGILGRPAYGISENIARNEFNELMRREYEGKEPLFDLATLESTRPDGSRQKFKTNDRSYDEMFDGYASDGGHLNEQGRRLIAARFLAVLASVPLPDTQPAATVAD